MKPEKDQFPDLTKEQNGDQIISSLWRLALQRNALAAFYLLAFFGITGCSGLNIPNIINNSPEGDNLRIKYQLALKSGFK